MVRLEYQAPTIMARLTELQRECTEEAKKEPADRDFDRLREHRQEIDKSVSDLCQRAFIEGMAWGRAEDLKNLQYTF